MSRLSNKEKQRRQYRAGHRQRFARRRRYLRDGRGLARQLEDIYAKCYHAPYPEHDEDVLAMFGIGDPA